MGAVAENFKVLLPVLNTVGDGFKKIARVFDPAIGSPVAGLSVLGGGLFGAFMLMRRMAATMGPWTRTLLGGGAGFLVGGGVGEALMGALLGRQMAASGAAAAAAAGAAAARTWGARFIGMAGTILRSGLGMILVSAGIYAVTQIVENWEAVKTRLLAIWEELRQAAPTWAGGQGRGWGTIGGRGTAVAQTDAELTQYLQTQERSWQDYFRSTSLGQWLIQNGYAMTDSQMALRRTRQDYRAMGVDLDSMIADSHHRSRAVPGTSTAGTTITTGPINVTVNVTQSNASPQAIGDAAGSAVGSGLRGAISDIGPSP